MIPLRGASPWLLRFPKSTAERRLYAFPCAGGGASAYQPWARALEEIQVVGVQPPARENRLREPPALSVSAMAHAIADAVVEDGAASFDFFGHSFGGLLAFETARELRRRGERQPERLIVSARPAPHLPAGLDAEGTLHEATDQRLVDVIRDLGGLPEGLALHPEFLSLFVPILRADLRAIATHVHQVEEPLACPIVAIAALADRLAPAAAVTAWRAYTAASFTFHTLPGGHFYLRDQQRALLALLAS